MGDSYTSIYVKTRKALVWVGHAFIITLFSLLDGHQV